MKTDELELESKQSSSTRDTADPSSAFKKKRSERMARQKQLYEDIKYGSSASLKRANPSRYDIVFLGASGTGKTTLLRKI